MYELNYLVLLNGKGVKKGTRRFSGEKSEEKFIEEMNAKYSRTADDCVEVLFR